ncbi:TetR/AcrR family transcriptional regulator [Streptomyces wedmorensis]|uniref:TetR/AcrR family transcriptional regulator n=1 Tax=Streptomyces wedmorensis TaxID=43759 RepID=A0ABW6J4G0_STRWE
MQTSSTRDRIVAAASRLIRRQGYTGTGVKQIAMEADATLGSVYHFFPGGKEALAVAALEHGREQFAGLLRAALDGEDDPAAAVDACACLLARELRASDWTDGCPVTAAALETLGPGNPIQRACADALYSWRNLIADKLLDCGLPDAEARDLAATVVHTLEGAQATAQVTRSEEPLLLAGRHLSRLVASYA